MTSKVHLRVPATTANVGPAFDCMGIALNYYNTLSAELTDKGVVFDISGTGCNKLPRNEKNLIYTTFAKTAKLLDKRFYGVRFACANNIPLNHGMGSSSAAIVSGIFCANELLSGGLSKKEIVEIATGIEGHPDNVAPAVYGGVSVSALEGSVVHSVRFMPARELQFVVAVPEYEVPTRLARAALPKYIAHADGVFNVSRAALLTAALMSGDMDSLAFALEDKLHQPHRAHLMPGMKQVFAAAKAAGALGAVVSGAGPTMLAICESQCNGAEVGQAMQQAFLECGKKAWFKVLSIDCAGATLEQKKITRNE